jgi:aminotransferase
VNTSGGTPAERMGLVPCSGIRRVFERAKTLDREVRPVIFLETGRPNFDTPVHIKEAAKRALDAGRVHYTSNHGIPELRAAIAES